MKSTPNRYFLFLFIVSLLSHLFLATIGWSNPLTDLHQFRQTQTAISTYYFLQTELKPNYEVPVLGPPWSIPF